jgi:hypothetical protein
MISRVLACEDTPFTCCPLLCVLSSPAPCSPSDSIPQLFCIGEKVRWLKNDQTNDQGKIIAPCNDRGEARILDENGKSWLVHSSWIWRDRQKATVPVMPDSSGDAQEATRTPAWTPVAQKFDMARLMSPESARARTGVRNEAPP